MIVFSGWRDFQGSLGLAIRHCRRLCGSVWREPVLSGRTQQCSPDGVQREGSDAHWERNSARAERRRRCVDQLLLGARCLRSKLLSGQGGRESAGGCSAQNLSSGKYKGEFCWCEVSIDVNRSMEVSRRSLGCSYSPSPVFFSRCLISVSAIGRCIQMRLTQTLRLLLKLPPSPVTCQVPRTSGE